MSIVGQFNLGFIVVRLRHEEDNQQTDDLFIIDQHAADEKYNFETLQATTRIDSQKLVRPRPLELTAADELIAIENADVLRENGFEISVANDDEDRSRSSGHVSRVTLVSHPVSGKVVFDMKDLEELLELLQDQPTPSNTETPSKPRRMVRCSKARAMFASRACRKSVMIGKALTKQQMTSVVRHMGTMDQPWNCPHGRPTMRHLVSLGGGDLKMASAAYAQRPVQWANFT
ncbi:hypothetical protein SCHPADRAFT_832663 [Schizopora paradoxa]|uniref:MutL C-terminal dimerisation domain-containing protein n=1 Tax=Schizopora paradoxa TaxID=27342 RepID=A0A0H2S026_9AGAM|nr:hypothetical protein SCHPADRAFT_832663 [Schizopora paradoxa]